MKILNGKLRLLPLLVLFGLAAMAVRSGDFIMSLKAVADDDRPGQQTVAGEGPQDSLSIEEMVERARMPSGDVAGLTPGAGEDEGDEADSKAEIAQADDPDQTDQGEGPSVTEKWRDAIDTQLDTSLQEREMMMDVRQRKKRLDKREQELATREALLKAAEKELDRKYREMAALRDDIAKLLEEQSEEEEARIESLVKIYSGMKADDAARIFNTLDLDILVDIMTRMSERKTGPILAEMNSEKARSVTIMLAEEKRLPELPENLRN